MNAAVSPFYMLSIQITLALCFGLRLNDRKKGLLILRMSKPTLGGCMLCLLWMCSPRIVVGWQTATHLYNELALDALNIAVFHRTCAGEDLSKFVQH